jgi:hypothetical protein
LALGDNESTQRLASTKETTMAELPLLDANLKTASQGMAVSVNKPLGQAYYARYYRAAAAEDYVRLAIAGAEANPYVDVANAATAALNKVQTDYEARRDLVQKIQRENQAAMASLNAARIKAAGKTSGRGVRFKELIDLYKAMTPAAAAQDSAYRARQELGSMEALQAQAAAYGDISKASQSEASAFQQIAQTANRPDFKRSQLAVIAQKDSKESTAIRALLASDNELSRGSNAAMLRGVLEREGMDSAAAAKLAGDVFRVDASLATEDAAAHVRGQLSQQLSQSVGASAGEERMKDVVFPAGVELMRMGLKNFQAGGGGTGAVRAEQQRQAAQKLTPDERGALDLFIAALRNDGKVTPDETVTIDGVERTLTEEELAAGKAAFDKAKKFGAYRPDEAQWFDEEAMDQFRSSLKYGADADKARAEALARGSRTPNEVQREMAERFLRTSTAAEDLEVYIPAAQVGNRFEAQALGGAMHIANREGKLVFDQTREAPDRKRRLGGLGPVATGPLRAAQDAYRQLAQGNDPVEPAALQPAVEQLRRKYANNPKKAMLAVQYLLAQNMVRERAQQNPASAEPGAIESNSALNRDANRPPTPDLPGAQAAVDDAKAYLAERRAGTEAERIAASAAMQDDFFGAAAPAPARVSAPAAPATPPVIGESMYETTGETPYTDADFQAERLDLESPVMTQQERLTGAMGEAQQLLRTPIETAGAAGTAISPITTNNGSRQPAAVRPSQGSILQPIDSQSPANESEVLARQRAASQAVERGDVGMAQRLFLSADSEAQRVYRYLLQNDSPAAAEKYLLDRFGVARETYPPPIPEMGGNLPMTDDELFRGRVD